MSSAIPGISPAIWSSVNSPCLVRPTTSSTRDGPLSGGSTGPSDCLVGGIRVEEPVIELGAVIYRESDCVLQVRRGRVAFHGNLSYLPVLDLHLGGMDIEGPKPAVRDGIV